MNDLKNILPEEDMARLLEDTGLTPEEISKQYQIAVAKAKSESSPQKTINRLQRRLQAKQIQRAMKKVESTDISRPLTERFDELGIEQQKELYMRILEKIRAENDKFERMKERDANGKGID